MTAEQREYSKDSLLLCMYNMYTVAQKLAHFCTPYKLTSSNID